MLCLGVFVACDQEETPAATLDDAKTYLANMYKDSASDPEKDYDLVGKVIVNNVSFTVTWKANISEITIKESTKKDFWTVDLPDVNTEEKAYVLTATITDADGKTVTVTLNRTLPVFENVAGVVTTPQAGTAYKLFFDQKGVGKVLYLLSEATNSENKFIKTTIDPKKAPDFFVEETEGGVKIYTMVGNTKTYVRAATTKGSDGKISKYLGFDTTGTVFNYNENYDAWYTTIDGIGYVMGTYGTYETASISEDSYYKTADKRATQFALSFITKEAAEAMSPSDVPADPTTLTSIAEVLEIGAAKDHNTYTAEKYLVKGTIVSIDSNKSGDGLSEYGNMYIEDESGDSIYVYGLYSSDGSVRFDKMDPQPKVGDVVTVMGIVGQYNDTPQIKNAWLMKLEAVECDHVYTADCDASCNKCSATREAAAHTYDNACDADCNACAATRTPAAHEYDNACDATCNVCEAVLEGVGHTYTNDCDAVCDVCEAEREGVGHEYSNACDAECNKCAEKRTPADHVYDNVCDTNCNVCNAEREAEDHIYDNACDADCNVCGATREVTHTVTADCDTQCDVCEATITTTVAHTYDADCDKNCNKCDASRPVDCKDADENGKCDYCGEVVDVASIEKGHIDYEAGKIKFTDVHVSGEATLPAVGADYSDVAITWAVDNADVAKVANGKVTFTAGTADATVTITATFTCGGTTDTKTYTVKVSVHVYDNACDTTCNLCGTAREVAAHVYENACDAECNECKAKRTVGDHVYTNACDADCNVCAATRTPADHVYDNACDADCNVCTATRTPADHKYDDHRDAECNECKKTTRTPTACEDTDNDGKCDSCGNDVTPAPEVGIAYKMYLAQKGLGKILYFKGEMDGFYFATTEDANEAVDIYVETVEGGVYLYFMKGENKSYLAIVRAIGTDGNEHDNVVLDAETPSVFVFNAELNTFTTQVGEETFYFGTYGTHKTISASSIDKVATNYISHLTTTPIDPATCEHDFADATCTETKYCKLCLATDGDALGHTEPDVNGLCTRCQMNLSGISVKEALEAEDGTAVTITGTISKIYEAYSSTFNNTAFYLTDDNGDTILCYRITGEWNVGDVVKVTGNITVYGGANQIAQGGTAEKLGTHTEHVWKDATCTDAKTCKVCGLTEGTANGHGTANSEGKCPTCGEDLSAVEKTLSFADVANRTFFSAESQVWEQNGITVTNNKGEYKNDLGDYSNPVRFYKGTEVVITCTGITKIVFNCNSASYATTLADTITGSVLSGKTVTVTFDSAVDSFTVKMTVAQVRLDSISVFVK